MTSLEEKIAARSGRLNLITVALAKLARVLQSQSVENQVWAEAGDDADQDLDDAVLELVALAGDYGTKWLDETANLLKEMYNRRAGP